jgi:hypothetical protein
MLQHLLHLAQRQQIGHQLLHHHGVMLFQVIEQLLHFGAPQQVGSMLAHHFGQVGGDDGGGFHHGVAQSLRFLALRRLDPEGAHPEHRLGGGNAFHRGCIGGGWHRQQRTRHHLRLCHHLAPNFNLILVGFQAHIVAHAHGGHHEAQLQRELPSDGGDALQQVAQHLFLSCGARCRLAGDFDARRRINQRQQPIAQLQLDGVHFEQGKYRFRSSRW